MCATELEEHVKKAMYDAFREFQPEEGIDVRNKRYYRHHLIRSEYDASFLFLRHLIKYIDPRRIRTELSFAKYNFQKQHIKYGLKKPDIILLNTKIGSSIMSNEKYPYSELLPFDAIIEIKRVPEEQSVSPFVRWFDKGFNKDITTLEKVKDDISILKMFIIFDDFNHFESKRIIPKTSGKKFIKSLAEYNKQKKPFFTKNKRNGIDWLKVSKYFPSVLLFVVSLDSLRTYKDGQLISYNKGGKNGS